jgi:DNA polymerase-3 subunit delta
MSLFGDKKLIDLRIPDRQAGRKGAPRCRQWCQHLVARQPAAGHPAGARLARGKAAWFTALVNAGVAVKLMAPGLPNCRLDRRPPAPAAAERRSGSLKFIAERVEGNLLAAHQEIQKLGLLYPAGQLTLAQIREAVLNVARYDIDGLREALLAGDVAA